MALDVKGNVHTWGKNDYGQLGNFDKEDKEFPNKLTCFKESISQIYAGENMSFAIDKRGETYVWGENKHNQLQIPGNRNKIDEPTRITYPSYF
mmetsp:Transcript_2345/g.2289  ORF Transcript_2345/g.2289 Transcript_2345/m.2289 type:complete len:93 (-) Transcript_2345:1164-1442(-)